VRRTTLLRTSLKVITPGSRDAIEIDGLEIFLGLATFLNYLAGQSIPTIPLVHLNIPFERGFIFDSRLLYLSMIFALTHYTTRGEPR